jgi:hypothetical protein
LVIPSHASQRLPRSAASLKSLRNDVPEGALLNEPLGNQGEGIGLVQISRLNGDCPFERDDSLIESSPSHRAKPGRFRHIAGVQMADEELARSLRHYTARPTPTIPSEAFDALEMVSFGRHRVGPCVPKLCPSAPELSMFCNDFTHLAVNGAEEEPKSVITELLKHRILNSIFERAPN